MIGEGQGGHSIARRTLHQSLHIGRSIQKTVFAMHMQMNELRCAHQSIIAPMRHCCFTRCSWYARWPGFDAINGFRNEAIPVPLRFAPTVLHLLHIKAYPAAIVAHGHSTRIGGDVNGFVCAPCKWPCPAMNALGLMQQAQRDHGPGSEAGTTIGKGFLPSAVAVREDSRCRSRWYPAASIAHRNRFPIRSRIALRRRMVVRWEGGEEGEWRRKRVARRP